MLIGYRTEVFSGSNIRDLETVVGFEMDYLKNTDIPYYIINQYRKLKEYEWMFDDDSFYYNNDGILECMQDLIQDIVDFVKTTLKTDNVSVVWLANNPKDVVNNYTLNKIDNIVIDRYVIEGKEMQDYMVISDIGDEGKLIAYNKDTNIHIKSLVFFSSFF